MDLHEFELRYRAYKGLNYKFDLDRSHDMILQMARISSKGTLNKPVQEIAPEELQEITLETYTRYKQEYLDTQRDNQVGYGSLATYVDRLEYELKVIKEMGFNSYFLIVADFVRRAKKNTIVV